MRGSRCKHLRAWFKRTTGKAPGKFSLGAFVFNKLHEVIGVRYTPSEWRRLKKAYKRGLLKSYPR